MPRPNERLLAEKRPCARNTQRCARAAARSPIAIFARLRARPILPRPLRRRATPTQTQATPSPSASSGTSQTPTRTPPPLPYGAIREIAVLDCNGGLHLLPNTPAEVNLNLRGLRFLLNFAADEIRQRARCLAARLNGGW
jgi:hypothetical protein